MYFFCLHSFDTTFGRFYSVDASFWLHRFCGKWESRVPVNRINHTSWVVKVTQTDRPRSGRNRVIEVFGGVFLLSLFFFKFPVSILAFVIWPSQISLFFSFSRMHAIVSGQLGGLNVLNTLSPDKEKTFVDGFAKIFESWKKLSHTTSFYLRQKWFTCPIVSRSTHKKYRDTKRGKLVRT